MSMRSERRALRCISITIITERYKNSVKVASWSLSTSKGHKGNCLVVKEVMTETRRTTGLFDLRHPWR